VIELYLRLAGATLLLLAPGALIARSASGALVVSLTLIFGALVVVFATGSSLTLALWLLLAAGIAAIPLGLRRPSNRLLLGFEERVWVGVLAAGIVFGLLLWRVLPPPVGDALFHLARVRKLLAFDGLSLRGVGEFADGGLHPGYAFPLWHGFLALVAKISGVDPTQVVTREAAVLAPLSLLVVYEAGKALFRSAWLGLATVVGTLALTAFSSGSGGAFRSLALPATAGGRQLLVPATLALLLAYLLEPSRGRLALVACAGLVLAAVHPTYALFTLVVVGGFACARALLAPEDLRGLVVGVGVLALSAGLFLVWLYPVVRSAASYTPTNEQLTSKQHGLERYPGQFDVSSPSRFRLAPEVVARAGAVPVAALCLVPLALFGARRRWGAFVLGGTVVVLLVLVVPFLFPHFADAVSISQSRRLAGFVPFAFALAGGLAVLARVLSWAVLPLALVAGVAVQRLWPGDFGYVLKEGGPTWPVWIALWGGLATLVAAALLRYRLPTLERDNWVVPAACVLFVLPIALTMDWRRPTPSQELTPGLVAAVGRDVAPGDVVLADPETSYWLSAYAPVYVAASAPTHVGDTKENRPYERAQEWRRFARTGRFAGRYDWLVLDSLRTRRTCAPTVYEDARYVLCASTQRR
jgi:hypothetical protein